MTSFMFDIPCDTPPTPSYEEQRIRKAWGEKVLRLQEQLREQEELRAVRPKEPVVTLRMPTDLLDRLDRVAESAATCRSQLIRQIIANFLNYTWDNDIEYRGSLLNFQHATSPTE